MLASIPSPSRNVIEIGPLDIRIYGLMIALGVILAVWFFGWRMQKRGINQEIAVSLAWVVVPAGIIGARLYHVITDWRRFSDEDRWGDVFKIWEGGLGIPGAVIAGVLAGAVLCRMRGWSLAEMLDTGAPALLAAQAVGRLGNWFNQELFGRPTDLPWGLEIDEANRPAEFFYDSTFHPTFLYEALWMLALMGLLLWLDKLRKLPVGHLFALYVLGYASGRIGIEFLRVDPASELAGVRVNVWVMSALWLGAAAYMYIFREKAAWPPEPVLDTGDGDGIEQGGETGEAEAGGAQAALADKSREEISEKADISRESEAGVEQESAQQEDKEDAMADGRVMSARDIAAEDAEGESPMALTDVMVAVADGEETPAEAGSEAADSAASEAVSAGESEDESEPETAPEAAPETPTASEEREQSPQ